jgi:nucleolar pre-ribosomal-associated protein 1
MQDWQICQRRHTFALLASIYQSSTEYNLRSLIIQSLQAMTAIPEASIHLAEKEGLVEWLEMACLNDQSTGRGATLEDVIGILENVVTALVQRDMSKSSKVFERGRRWHIQVLGCLQRIAPVEGE